LNTRSEIVITIRRGDWTFEVKSAIEDEDLVSFDELAQTLASMAESASQHLESMLRDKIELPPPPPKPF
jgi:hypothetical protein